MKKLKKKKRERDMGGGRERERERENQKHQRKEVHRKVKRIVMMITFLQLLKVKC